MSTETKTTSFTDIWDESAELASAVNDWFVKLKKLERGGAFEGHADTACWLSETLVRLEHLEAAAMTLTNHAESSAIKEGEWV